MKIDPKMEAAINRQINAEFYSAYLYLAMAAYFEGQNLPGMAAWMKAQAQEEVTHAMKFFEFVNQRDGRVVLDAIEKPPSDWNSPAAVFKAAWQHEQKVTELINGLVDLAKEIKDPATEILLQWFVTEQIEEETSTRTIAEQLEMLQEAPHALFMMDRELGQRGAAPTE